MAVEALRLLDAHLGACASLRDELLRLHQLFMTHLPINQFPPSSFQSHKTKQLCVCVWGGDFAKSLGNERAWFPGVRGEGATSVGEGKKESSDLRESLGVWVS